MLWPRLNFLCIWTIMGGPKGSTYVLLLGECSMFQFYFFLMGESMWVILPKKTKRKKRKKKNFDHTHQLINKKHEYTWVLVSKGKANKMTLVKTMSSLSLIKLCQKRQSSWIYTWVLFPKGIANKMTLMKAMSSLSLIKLCQKRQSSHEKVG
jgi:homospermidine synthase